MFTDFTRVEPQLVRALATFESRASGMQGKRGAEATSLHPVEVASSLFYDVMTIHPFRDGNGRLSRMLFSYALQRFGCPFPVEVTSGHRKTKQHYYAALEHAQLKRHFSGLNALARASVVVTAENVMRFCA